MNAEQQLFFAQWVRNPMRLASPLPMGAAAAGAMAREMRLDRAGVVLELGAGSGSVTHALLAAGCPPGRLAAVEREPSLARHLRATFPGVIILEGDVAELDRMLDGAGVGPLASVISTLPILWFSLALKRYVVEASMARLGRDGVLAQATNAFCSPIPRAALGLEGRVVARIWRHFLPIQVWRYSRP